MSLTAGHAVLGLPGRFFMNWLAASLRLFAASPPWPLCWLLPHHGRSVLCCKSSNLGQAGGSRCNRMRAHLSQLALVVELR
jgi:hypothetical protein